MRHFWRALASVPTSTAQACAAETDSGVNEYMRYDLDACKAFFGTPELTPSVRTTKETDATGETGNMAEVAFSEYSDASDLFASWYIQNYITPLHQEEEIVFSAYFQERKLPI